jgi:magnesium-transporting ATPase (P-type)
LVVIVFGIARFKITTGVALYAISLALAIIPESLSAVVTITIAKGITNMARHNAIVRRLDAIEALGRIGDICCDKTGTLTTGKMVVRKYWNGEELLYFEGGDLSLSEVKVMTTKAGDNLFDFLPCIALCNNAAVFKAMGAWQAHGEATEVTLLRFSLTKGRLANMRHKAELCQVESRRHTEGP